MPLPSRAKHPQPISESTGSRSGPPADRTVRPVEPRQDPTAIDAPRSGRNSRLPMAAGFGRFRPLHKHLLPPPRRIGLGLKRFMRELPWANIQYTHDSSSVKALGVSQNVSKQVDIWDQKKVAEHFSCTNFGLSLWTGHTPVHPKVKKPTQLPHGIRVISICTFDPRLSPTATRKNRQQNLEVEPPLL